jgi:hypothetical protein
LCAKNCGRKLGRAQTICNQCADDACRREEDLTKEFFDEHRNAVFVLRGSVNVHVGKGGKVRN